ncbi:alpha-galactosidase [Belliella sp. DSM 107340]|uniref:Alpha-galactosidase n=1 Tax=Belliella calami TaxID=2923436 RepID=A0ABS9UN43_9BACT|nr:alpha-galactosidase [Belliella calami]MCH7398036.1 alpha-galactosidase [Belliella calami]
MQNPNVKFWLYIFFFFVNSQINAQNPQLTWNGDTLTISNDLAAHHFLWNGQLHLLGIDSFEEGIFWKSKAPKPDLFLSHVADQIENVSVRSAYKKDFPTEHEYLEVILESTEDSLAIRYALKMFANSGALYQKSFIKGNKQNITWESSMNEDLMMIEELKESGSNDNRVGVFSGKPYHLDYEVISFKEATDYHDDPVSVKVIKPFRQPQKVDGNILYAVDKHADNAIWFIKDSPIAASQANYPGFDFTIYPWGVAVNGLGIGEKEYDPQNWNEVYGFARGISKSNHWSKQKAIIKYQQQLRKYDANRDEMLLANTWGDRSKDSRMNEKFILEEIEMASILGITHLQLDDGWQQGLSRNSASKAGKKWDDWNREDWNPHKERFPNGLSKIIQEGNAKGVEICLWFNPSKAEEYNNWERDADILIGFYQEYGIKVFKIDGLALGSKKAEKNIKNLFDKVMRHCNGKVVFNLDVTAGKRTGYHFFQEYGNVFLENRYTDWGNYFPYRTLRNLWLLSGYMPAARLQAEWLNVGRNKDKYGEDDPHAPFHVGQRYAFAASLVGQPLAWMELSGLEDVKDSLSTIISEYRTFAHDIHSGLVIPIGEEPSGSSWTGFLIEAEEVDYLLVYRELTDTDSHTFPLPRKYGKASILFGDEFETQILENGIQVKFQKHYSFCVFKLEKQ